MQWALWRVPLDPKLERASVFLTGEILESGPLYSLSSPFLGKYSCDSYRARHLLDILSFPKILSIDGTLQCKLPEFLTALSFNASY